MQLVVLKTMTNATNSPSNRDDESRRALIRTLTNGLNQRERHHRQTMASQEDLSAQIDERQHRNDVGIGEVLKMQMRTEDARKDDNDTHKKELAEVKRLLGSILKELQGNDFLRIPKEERQFTEDPEEEL